MTLLLRQRANAAFKKPFLCFVDENNGSHEMLSFQSTVKKYILDKVSMAAIKLIHRIKMFIYTSGLDIYTFDCISKKS